MKECGACGFPDRLNKFLEWHSDGTIIGSVRPRIPLMFIEVAEWDAVFTGVSEKLGLPIDHILIEAQKNIGKELYEMVRGVYVNFDIRRIPVTRLLRPQWLGKLIVRVMREDLSAFGAGRPELVGYRAGSALTLRFKNPSLLTMVVGNCLGIYESIERMPTAEAEFGLEDGDLVVMMRPSAESSEVEARLYVEEVQPGIGALDYEPCPTCGVPLVFAESVKWETSRGTITNVKSSRREGMISVQSLAAMIRELTNELGEEVPGILYEAQKAYTRERLAQTDSDGAEFMDGLLLDMGLRGMGYPTLFQYKDGKVMVSIDSAYDHDLYAARLAGAVEHLEGKDSSIEWRVREPRHSEYAISCGK
jgi:hypothetical protein